MQLQRLGGELGGVMARPLPERVLELLPIDGSPLLYRELLDRARAARLSSAEVGAALVTLCAAREAVSKFIMGWLFVRRLQAGEDTAVPRPAPPRC